jgi:hypothetical protein
MDEIRFRRAGAQDLHAILEIQAANYVANLSLEDRADGFLSAEFTHAQIAAMAADLGIMVACDSKESVLAYLCGFRCDFNHQSPVVAKMLDSFATAEFEGRPLNSYNTFIYGPVCIRRAHRGRGLLRGLYEQLNARLRERSKWAWHLWPAAIRIRCAPTLPGSV